MKEFREATQAKIFLSKFNRHDMLVFLTGQEEIESMCRQIRQVAQEFDGPRLVVVPLFAAQQSGVQQKVFIPTKPGCRKVVLATNIAETSLTIPGIRYVVDSCRVKAKLVRMCFRLWRVDTLVQCYFLGLTWQALDSICSRW